jgi:hypothetical protein
MLKLLGLFVGLVAVVATRAGPPPASAAAQRLASAQALGAPPLYAARDVFSALGVVRP